MANRVPEEALATRDSSRIEGGLRRDLLPTEPDTTQQTGSEPKDRDVGRTLPSVEHVDVGGGAHPCEVIGRYSLHTQIGSGGMASVHLGWMAGAADFSRVVAIKRMHPQLALESEFATRFRDEAWISARVLHPNIVQVLDVVEWKSELLIVMEYVHGVSLRALWGDANAAGCVLPPSLVAGILVPALHGLHAAHEATDDDGRPLGIVHRDFSPQNIIVGADGNAKVLDFGVAKARTHLHVTYSGQLSGKAGYLSPEQVLAGVLDRRTDVFAAGIVLWELLTGQRLFREPGHEEASTFHRVLSHAVRPPSEVNPGVPRELDPIVLRALERNPDQRYGNARDLALELEGAIGLASSSTIASWVERFCGRRMDRLSEALSSVRRSALRAQQLPVVDRRPTLSESTIVDAAPKSEKPPWIALDQGMMAPSTSDRRRIGWKVAAGVLGGLCLAALLFAFSFSLGRRLRETRLETFPPVSSPSSMPSSEILTAASSRLTPSRAAGTGTGAGAGDDAVGAGAGAVVSAGLPPSREAAVVASGSSAPGSSSRPHARAGRTAPVTGNPNARAVSAGPKSPNCDPPTYLDPDGIRIFKDGCL